MKIVRKKGTFEYDARELIERFGSYYIQGLAKQIKSPNPNDLTDDVIKILVKDCCEYLPTSVYELAKQIRLLNKLTDEYIELFIKSCVSWHLHDLAEQLRLADKLTDYNIELLIKQCSHHDIPTLVQEIPDDYKPTDEVVKILQEKGYEVLD